MDFIAVLDFDHLDNGMFLTAFARSLSRRASRGIIIHEDSEYTDRLIQTGMMREDARRRAIRDLNHRLVALFADQGVSTIAVNGYQKSLIRLNRGQILVDTDQIAGLPEYPMLLISGLADAGPNSPPAALPMADLAFTLGRNYPDADVVIFSAHGASGIIKEDLPKRVIPGETDKEFRNKYIPESFHQRSETVTLTTAEAFGNG